MQHILIDCDPGVDDALALIYAFNSPELHVEGITTVNGNAPVAVCSRNLLIVLETIGLEPSRYPILGRGSPQPLVKPWTMGAEVHGRDGLGNTTSMFTSDGARRYPDPQPRPAEATATDVIIELAQKFAPELILVATGPLTNLAEALLKDPARMRMVREIVIMGGAFGTYGNVTLAAEFNVSVDPHAAQIVFDSGVPITVFPLNVTQQVQLLRDRLEAEAALRDDRLTRFILDSTLAVTEFDSAYQEFYGTHLHDPLTVIYLTHPELFETVETRIAVETEGQLTQGATIAELRPNRPRDRTNARVCVGVDVEAVLRIFYERSLRRRP